MNAHETKIDFNFPDASERETTEHSNRLMCASHCIAYSDDSVSWCDPIRSIVKPIRLIIILRIYTHRHLNIVVKWYMLRSASIRWALNGSYTHGIHTQVDIDTLRHVPIYKIIKSWSSDILLQKPLLSGRKHIIFHFVWLALVFLYSINSCYDSSKLETVRFTFRARCPCRGCRNVIEKVKLQMNFRCIHFHRCLQYWCGCLTES